MFARLIPGAVQDAAPPLAAALTEANRPGAPPLGQRHSVGKLPPLKAAAARRGGAKLGAGAWDATPAPAAVAAKAVKPIVKPLGKSVPVAGGARAALLLPLAPTGPPAKPEAAESVAPEPNRAARHPEAAIAGAGAVAARAGGVPLVPPAGTAAVAAAAELRMPIPVPHPMPNAGVPVHASALGGHVATAFALPPPGLARIPSNVANTGVSTGASTGANTGANTGASVRIGLEGRHEMRVELHPAALGSVVVHIERAMDGSVTVQVCASLPATQHLLAADTNALHAALTRAGLPAAAMQISVPLTHADTNGRNAGDTGGTATGFGDGGANHNGSARQGGQQGGQAGASSGRTQGFMAAAGGDIFFHSPAGNGGFVHHRLGINITA